VQRIKDQLLAIDERVKPTALLATQA